MSQPSPPPFAVVPSGVSGLDRMLGGGIRLLERVPGAGTSAVVLLRGEAGTGKTVLAAHVASAVARARKEDVLFACVESLPTEIAAQIGGFGGLRDLLPMRSASDETPFRGEATRAFGLVLDTEGPGDKAPHERLGDGIEAGLKYLERGGALPRVVVVDGLSDAYGVGPASPRKFANGLALLAAGRGLTMILTEEAPPRAPSPWSHVSDSVVELWRGADAMGVLAAAVKNRFGPCESAPRRLSVDDEGPHLFNMHSER